MPDISSYFQPLRDQTAALAQHFNVVNCRPLIIVQRQAGGATLYTEIVPRPIIKTVSPNLAQSYEGIEGIQIELDDLETHVSRRYAREEIVGRGISYLIDAVMTNGKPVGGIEADKVQNVNIVERDLHWELILRRRT